MLCVEGFYYWGTEINWRVDNKWWPTWFKLFSVRFHCTYVPGYHCFSAGNLLYPALWKILYGKESCGRVCKYSRTYQGCLHSTSVAAASEHYNPEPKKWACYCYMKFDSQMKCLILQLQLTSVSQLNVSMLIGLRIFFTETFAAYMFSNEHMKLWTT